MKDILVQQESVLHASSLFQRVEIFGDLVKCLVEKARQTAFDPAFFVNVQPPNFGLATYVLKVVYGQIALRKVARCDRMKQSMQNMLTVCLNEVLKPPPPCIAEKTSH